MTLLDELIELKKRVQRLETQELGVSANGGWTLIEEISPSGVDNVNFTSIPSIFRNLRVVWVAQSDSSATAPTIAVQFNGDTTAGNYEWSNHQVVFAITSTDIHTISGASDNDFPIAQIPGSASAGVNASDFGFGWLEIPHYTANVWKGILSTSGGFEDARDNIRLTTFSGRWKDTTAVNAIKIFLGASNFSDDDSVFTLYGQN